MFMGFNTQIIFGAFLERKEVTIQPTNWYIGGEEDGDEGAQT